MISQILDEVKSSKDELFIDLGSGKDDTHLFAYCFLFSIFQYYFRIVF